MFPPLYLLNPQKVIADITRKKLIANIVESDLRNIVAVLIFNSQQNRLPEELRLYPEDAVPPDEFLKLKTTAKEYINILEELGYESLSRYYTDHLEKHTGIFPKPE